MLFYEVLIKLAGPIATFATGGLLFTQIISTVEEFGAVGKKLDAMELKDDIKDSKQKKFTEYKKEVEEERRTVLHPLRGRFRW